MQAESPVTKTSTCLFCSTINGGRGSLDVIPGLDLGLFVAAYDRYPVTPGHVLIIPKRHTQFMRELRNDEQLDLCNAVTKTKEYLLQADLNEMYFAMSRSSNLTLKEKAYIAHCRKTLAKFNRPPDSFNDGVNDGPAAGQTIPHFHWHIMPRWQHDVADPRGGVRHMFTGMGNYHTGMVSRANTD